MSERVLSLAEVVETVRLKKSTIYVAIRQNTFPLPIRCGTRAMGWKLSDIENWIATRPHFNPRETAISEDVRRRRSKTR